MFNTIIHGDCLRILPQLSSESVNFILTDPPYMINYEPRDGRSITNDDNCGWLKPAFAQMYRVLARDSFCVSFYGFTKADAFLHAYRAAGFKVAGHFTFPKRRLLRTVRPLPA
jgi:site-specific DNA-methyltransferase (adenine-specific)